MKEKESIMHTRKKSINLTIAVIQIELELGNIKRNFDHTLPLIEQAIKKGAQLIVLPELFSSGYFINKEIWDFAENTKGPTARYLENISKKYSIYIGAGFVETDGKNIYDSFMMTNPNGKIIGIVRKNKAEAYVFKRKKANHIIQTPFGKIGVGICADSQFFNFLKQMHNESVDILLMPHAAPLPKQISKLIKEKDYYQMHQKLKELPIFYSKALGIPTIFVNPISILKKVPGIIGKLIKHDLFIIKGYSRIIDSDGKIKGELQENEGILVNTVILQPERKKYIKPKNYHGWITPGSFLFRKIIMPLDILFGKIFYRLNCRRKNLARKKFFEFQKPQ
ncbi:MAG: carbon-nitrogen hydrolase family protein [Asgard group archaeon]|nr:carbon-nitrogen hydrolase family protein [Asgard group archaeon]